MSRGVRAAFDGERFVPDRKPYLASDDDAGWVSDVPHIDDRAAWDAEYRDRLNAACDLVRLGGGR